MGVQRRDSHLEPNERAGRLRSSEYGKPRAFFRSEYRAGPCVAISSGEEQALAKDVRRTHEIFGKVAFLHRGSFSFPLRFK